MIFMISLFSMPDQATIEFQTRMEQRMQDHLHKQMRLLRTMEESIPATAISSEEAAAPSNK